MVLYAFVLVFLVYRYTERLLCAGDQLSVVGELRSHLELRGTTQNSLKILREWKHDQTALLQRFDTNLDGRIDAAEWEQARLAAEKEARAMTLNTPVARMNVIGEPTDDKPFIIAPLDSARLVRREKRHAVMYLCAGLGCTVVCAGALMAIV